MYCLIARYVLEEDSYLDDEGRSFKTFCNALRQSFKVSARVETSDSSFALCIAALDQDYNKLATLAQNVAKEVERIGMGRISHEDLVIKDVDLFIEQAASRSL